MNEMTKARDGFPQEHMLDSQGRMVPLANVRAQDLLEDELVRQLHRKARELAMLLAQFKASGFDQVDGFLALLAQNHDTTMGGVKGNISLSSYDGNLRVQVAIGNSLTFGPELQVAKQLVDQCIRAWSQGANANLSAIVNDAFDVDQEGKLNVERILALRRLEIDDPVWKQAMEAISGSVRVARSKRYLRFYRRYTAGRAHEQVKLDLASV